MDWEACRELPPPQLLPILFTRAESVGLVMKNWTPVVVFPMEPELSAEFAVTCTRASIARVREGRVIIYMCKKSYHMLIVVTPNETRWLHGRFACSRCGR